MELEVPPAPKRSSIKKKADRRNAVELLQSWCKDGITFEEDAYITLYRFKGGKLRFVKEHDGEHALTSVDVTIPEGTVLETWQVTREQARCGLLNVRVGSREAQLCFRYRVSNKFVHATLSYVNSAPGYSGTRRSYPTPVGYHV